MDSKFDVAIILFIVCVVIVLIKFACVTVLDDYNWNDGICVHCGGKLEYVQPIGHAYSTNYLYECNGCGNVVEFSKKR
jgi:hypothetical protein